ncbi:MAG: Kelch repeat-containing protein [Candidatus Limnocylindrales bacterium]
MASGTAVHRALPPGAVRRRTFFGLLDADSWLAAFLKALLWFLLIIFLLGYLPDRAYYFTVFPTIDVGANVISPVNFCDGQNKNLPCPAPPGAVVPWESSPSELALPEARTGAATALLGSSLHLVGGTVGESPTESVLATDVTTTGTFGQWREGPALPEARSQAAGVMLSGVPYIVGGLDASGEPTDTVLVGTVESGALQGWEVSEDLRLPRPLSHAAAAATAGGIIVVGGREGEALSNAVYFSAFDSATPPELGAFEELAAIPLPEPRADAEALRVGNFIYVLGGEAPSGVSNSLYRLALGRDGRPIGSEEGGTPQGWAVAQDPGQQLPEPRAAANTFTANSAIYVVGGRGADGAATASTYWAVPNASTGDIPEWRRLSQTNLPGARADAASAVVGSFAFLIGGESAEGPDASGARSNLAPRPPFFRFGLLGATLPALSIKGEIGQQLGYVAAFTVGLGNFTLLVLIGLAFSHREQTRRILSRLTRGRVRAPREDEYFDGTYVTR